MGVFVDYVSKLFSNVSSTPTTLIETGALNEPHSLIINSITVTNKGSQPIRFNLQKVRTGAEDATIFLTNQYSIEANKTVDIIRSETGNIFLEYAVIAPLVSEKLVCFTNGVSQSFDCEISYTRLNETPLSL